MIVSCSPRHIAAETLAVFSMPLTGRPSVRYARMARITRPIWNLMRSMVTWEP